MGFYFVSFLKYLNSTGITNINFNFLLLIVLRVLPQHPIQNTHRDARHACKVPAVNGVLPPIREIVIWWRDINT